MLDSFKEFHVRVEREAGKKLKAVKANSYGEYSEQFERYCKLSGIRLEKTSAKTPQLNDVAERMSRAIVERIKCMLSHTKLPKTFWGKAIRTIVDLINLSPVAVLDSGVSNRVWT